MGFFSHLFHEVTQPVTRLIGRTATNILFPSVPITHFAGGLIDTLSNKILAGHATPPHVSSVPIQQRYAPQPNIIYGGGGFQPTPYYGGGGGFDYSYQPAQAFQGGSPWDYSTPSFQPSTMPSQTFSAPAQDRSWEDLILEAAPLFL